MRGQAGLHTNQKLNLGFRRWWGKGPRKGPGWLWFRIGLWGHDKIAGEVTGKGCRRTLCRSQEVPGARGTVLVWVWQLTAHVIVNFIRGARVNALYARYQKPQERLRTNRRVRSGTFSKSSNIAGCNTHEGRIGTCATQAPGKVIKSNKNTSSC